MAGMAFLAAVCKPQNFITVKIVTQELPKCASCYQTVRWRKPRWVPVSASKQFYVRTPTNFDPEETAELKVRQPRYNTSLRAVRRFILDWYLADLKRSKIEASQDTEEQDEFNMLMEENREWNERVAIQREKRQAKEKEKLQAIVDHRVAKKLKMRVKQEQKAERTVQAYMEESKHFITLENLDTEIEKVLNSRSDYNFAIDTEGQKITDFDSKPSKDTSKKNTDPDSKV